MKKVIKSLFFAALLVGVASASEAEQFGGLGISVWTGKSGVKVVGVLPNSPAESIGLATGDLIIAANGTELSAVEPGQQVSYLRGEAGTTINLIVERGDLKITLSTKRVDISVQNLNASDISAWYGKSEGLSAEEISHLAIQKTGEGYELLGVMQNGLPLAMSAENLSASAMQHVSVKKVENLKLPEAKPINNNAISNADAAVLNGQKDFTLVNVKGARAKQQNSVPLYKLLK